MAPSTPCTQLCRLDEAGAVCVGCFRTAAEIGSWPYLSEAQRLAIMRTLPARRPAGRAAAE